MIIKFSNLTFLLKIKSYNITLFVSSTLKLPLAICTAQNIYIVSKKIDGQGVTDENILSSKFNLCDIYGQINYRMLSLLATELGTKHSANL